MWGRQPQPRRESAQNPDWFNSARGSHKRGARGRSFPQPTEAPIGLDNLTNGLVDQTTHDADSAQFAEIEGVAFGIGPVFNDVSCGNCHADAGVMGTATQNKELRVGYFR